MTHGRQLSFWFSSCRGCRRYGGDVPFRYRRDTTRSVHICSLVVLALLLYVRRKAWSFFYSNKVSPLFLIDCILDFRFGMVFIGTREHL